jgi:hypothetical protein
MFFDEIRAASGVHDATFNRRFQTPLVPNFVGIFHSPKRNFDNSPGFQLQRLLKTSTVKSGFVFDLQEITIKGNTMGNQLTISWV